MRHILLAGLAFSALLGGQASWGQVSYSTGAIPTPPQEYAALPELPRARSEILLSTVDLSSMFPPAGSQGGQGSCTGWAIAYAARSYYKAEVTDDRPDTPPEIASPGFQFNLTALAPPHVDPACGGAYYGKALEFARDVGALPLAEWPYRNTCLPNVATPAQLNRAAQFRIPGFRSLGATNGEPLDRFKEALQDGHPVLVALVIRSQAWYQYRGSFTYREADPNSIPAPSQNDPVWGYHAMVAVGYDDQRGAIKLMNSWGDDWGDNGFMWIDYETFTESTHEAFVMTGMAPAIRPLDSLIDPTPPDPNADLMAQVRNAIQGYPSLVLTLVEHGDRVRVEGHGCATAAERLRAQLASLGDRVSVRLEETPWPACEARGLLDDASRSGDVTLSVSNLTPDAPDGIRGIDIDTSGWDTENVVVTPVFRNGDLLKIDTEVSDALPILQLFYIQADQSAKEVYRGEVARGSDGTRSFSIGDRASGVKLTVQPPFGTEAIIALAGRKPLIEASFAENEADATFMDRLRSALRKAEDDGEPYAAAVSQLQIEDAAARSEGWLITPEEYARLRTADPFGLDEEDAGARSITELGHPDGPRIRVISPDLSVDRLPSEVTIEAAFEALEDAEVDLSTLKVKYKSMVGWFDVTDRVRGGASVTAEGIRSDVVKLPKGKHRLRLSLQDSEGREGLVEFRIRVS